MELVIYGTIFILISISIFWLAGSIYGLLRTPKMYFPLSLAAKMCLTTILGSFIFMVGGIVLSTVIFDAQMQKRDDYKRWPTIFTGIAISTLSLIPIFFTFQLLIWDALQRST